MDRISALRNIEEALQSFETGEIDLLTAEQRVQGVLRTYATSYESDERAVYRAVTDGEETIVVAASEPAAADRVERLTGAEPSDIERLD